MENNCKSNVFLKKSENLLSKQYIKKKCHKKTET